MMKNGKRVPCGRSTTEMKQKKLVYVVHIKRNKDTRTVGSVEQMKARVKAKLKNPENYRSNFKNKKTLKIKEHQKIKNYQK